MARQTSTNTADGIPLWNMVGGIDRSVPGPRINDLGLSEAMNVVIVDGIIKPRPGLNAARFPAPPLGTYDTPCTLWMRRDRATQVDKPYLFVWVSSASPTGDVRELKVLSYTSGGGWVTETLFGANTSSLDDLPQMTQFEDTTVVVSGTGPGKINTTTAFPLPLGWSFLNDNAVQPKDALKAPLGCKFVTSSGSRVFMANGIPFGTSIRRSNRVWWSDTGVTHIWSNGTGDPERGSASYEDLRQGEYGAHEITGMSMHSSMQLLVFKSWGIWAAVWRGEGVWWSFIPGTYRVGTLAHNTIKQWRDQLIFLGTDYNIYAIGTNQAITSVGTRLQRYLASIINHEYVNRSVALVNPIENLYYLWIPVAESEFPNHLIVLNLETGALTEGSIADPICSAYAYYPGYTDTAGLFVTQAIEETGEIRELNYEEGCNDDDDPFAPYIWSKVYDFSEVYNQFSETGEIHKIALQGKSGKASTRTRVGANLYSLANATPLVFGEQDMEAVEPPSYVSERTNRERFAQWGVTWASGESRPLPVEGIKVWSLGRGDER